jgi:uncharacterized protein YchJ
MPFLRAKQKLKPMDKTDSIPKMKKRLYPFIKGDGKPFHAQKIGRNDPCPCKSGKKVKNCCKLETKYYTKKDPVKKLNLTEAE